MELFCCLKAAQGGSSPELSGEAFGAGLAAPYLTSTWASLREMLRVRGKIIPSAFLCKEWVQALLLEFDWQQVLG